MSEYIIYTVQIAEKFLSEPMGSKAKFWCLQPVTGTRWLFKYKRENSGEDWSEKIASEIAELLFIPHAVVELAQCQGKNGIISKDITNGGIIGQLVHGNELLAEIDPKYPIHGNYKVPEHSVVKISEALGRPYIHSPSSISPYLVSDPKDLFLGYLFLDALIGNVDRHHENWAVLSSPDKSGIYAELAPTFDHASSLGRELTEQKRSELLKNHEDFIRYLDRGKSAIYVSGNKVSPIGAFQEFSKECSTRDIWLDRLDKIDDSKFGEVIEKMPASIMSSDTRAFVCKILIENKKRLLSR
jgi:hypothetical protein